MCPNWVEKLLDPPQTVRVTVGTGRRTRQSKETVHTFPVKRIRISIRMPSDNYYTLGPIWELIPEKHDTIKVFRNGERSSEKLVVEMCAKMNEVSTWERDPSDLVPDPYTFLLHFEVYLKAKSDTERTLKKSIEIMSRSDLLVELRLPMNSVGPNLICNALTIT